ncbi:MAG: bifunctional cytochrome P450/NADPH--P450 reductase [Rhizobiaceae bacterium]
MANTVTLERIPEPDKMPLIGNILSVDKDAPLQSLMDITRELGGIYRLDMMGTPIVMVSDAEMVAELCDESRFDKAVRGALRRVRAIGGDGLFTGNTHDPNWSKAHNILMPTFSRQAMINYMPQMIDVATQLVTKWERLNADDEIDVVHDMTAVALDTIGICGFDYRFNSFYRRDYHPFIDSLTRTLETCMMQRGLPFEETLLRKRLQQMEEDVGFMNKLVDDLIRERRMGGGETAQNDLMNYMMSGVDKQTGESLSDENIRYQINTFLIAGHETTSGLMSFTLYFLLNNPEVLEKADAEVDRVLGHDFSLEPTLKQVNQLTYIQQILSESLRLWPTAPALGLAPYEDEIIGGKYKIKKGTFVNVLLLMLHRDPKVWGPDPEKFDPENFSKEAIAKRPIHAYKPFGNGKRACIGRQFALQEATMMIGMILQRFQLFDHTNYKLKIKESLSIKPDGFTMKVKLRPDVIRGGSKGPAQTADGSDAGLAATAQRPSHGTKALILYGSNLGTTEELARNIARSADLSGFETELAPLDSYVDKLPREGIVIMASASYNGTPPDNAGKFVDWLETAEKGALDGVRYTVFGCGHSDWAATYMATPRIIDEQMERLGATRLYDRAEANAKDDLDEQYEEWFGPLWITVGKALDLDVDFSNEVEAAPLYSVEFLEESSDNPLVSQVGAQPVTISGNRELQEESSGRSTRHIEVELAEGMSYAPGDHLSVVPRNSPDLVKRVEKRFGLQTKGYIKLTATSAEHCSLPTDKPLSIEDLLYELIELQSPASRRDVEMLAKYTGCPSSKPQLEALAGEKFKDEVFAKKLSVLDLLERFPACELPFAIFLQLCPNMVSRYYSISSSPKQENGKCAITVAIVRDKARGSDNIYEGVCSGYLAAQEIGATIHAATRQPSAGFTLPEDNNQPIIMVGPGTGIAPFRGFLQERAALKADSKTLGPAMLFFGCRHPEQDFIYEDELKAFEKDGIADLHVAFSRKERKRVYVQDVLRDQRDAVWALIEKGAKIFVCGDGGHMEPDVRRALALMYREETDCSEDEAEAWLAGLMREGRYVLDVWVSD